MKMLVELYGVYVAMGVVDYLLHEHPGMHDDYYIRNAYRILSQGYAI